METVTYDIESKIIGVTIRLKRMELTGLSTG
jgi:hypothetical protein